MLTLGLAYEGLQDKKKEVNQQVHCEKKEEEVNAIDKVECARLFKSAWMQGARNLQERGVLEGTSE